MKKLFALIGAGLMGMALIAASSPATAGPSPRVSVRATMSEDCTLTVRAAWGGLVWATPSSPTTVTVWVKTESMPYAAAYRVMAVKKGGRFVATFTGTPTSTETPTHVEISSTDYDDLYVSGFCTDWVSP